MSVKHPPWLKRKQIHTRSSVQTNYLPKKQKNEKKLDKYLMNTFACQAWNVAYPHKHTVNIINTEIWTNIVSNYRAEVIVLFSQNRSAFTSSGYWIE